MYKKLLTLFKALPIYAWIIVLLLIGFAGNTMYLNAKLRQEKDRSRNIGLALDSAIAVNDTLRDLSDSINGELHSVKEERNFFERRAMQSAIALDDLDNLLDQESALRAHYEAVVDTLEAQLEGTTTADGEDRLATFEEYIEPYSVKMEVRLPPPPELGSADVTVSVDPIDVGVRVGCKPEDELSGVRPASVLLDLPTWVKVNSLDVQQDPDVCNPRKEETPFFKSWKMGVLGTVVTGFGVTIVF